MFRSAERQRIRTRRLYALAIALFAFIAIGIFALVVREELAEVLLEASVDTGVDGAVAVTVEQLTFSTFVATNLTMGEDGPSLTRLEARYSIESLMSGSVDVLIIDGLELATAFDGSRLSISGVGELDLSSGSTEQDGTATFPLLPFKRIEFNNSHVFIATPFVDGVLEIQGTGQLGGPDLAADAQFTASIGNSRVLSGALEHAGTTTALDLVFSGTPFSLNSPEITLRPSGSLNVIYEPQAFELAAGEPLSLDWTLNAPERQNQAGPEDALSDELTVNAGRLTVQSLAADESSLIRVFGPPGELVADLSVAALVSTGGGQATARLDGSWAVEGLESIAATEIRQFDLSAQQARLLGATWSGVATVEDLVLEDVSASAALSYDIGWSDASGSPLKMESGSTQGSGRLERKNNEFVLSLSSANFTGQDIRLTDTLSVPETAVISVPDGQAFDVIIRPDGAMALSGQLAISNTGFRAGSFEGSAAVPLLTVSGLLTDAPVFEANWQNGALTSNLARLTQANGTITWELDKWTLGTSAQIRRLVGETSQAVVRTIQLAAESRGEEINVSGQLGNASVPDVVRISGLLGSTDEGLEGAITIRAPEQSYSPGTLSGAILHERLSPLTGDLALTSRIEVRGNSVTPSLRLILDDANWRDDGISADGIFGVVELDQLWPPESSSPQVLAVRSVDAGVPITNGVLNLLFTGGGRGEVTDAGFDFAGGQLTLEPFDFSLAPLTASTTVRAQGIDAGVVGDLFGVDGLAASGTLEGRLPLRIEQGAVMVESGFLRAAQAGQLIYRPSIPPAALSQGSASLMLDALDNFQYDRLAVSLDGPLDGDLTAAVALAGKNPDLYGGYPFELNLTVNGALGQIARQGASSYSIPERIQRNIQQGLAETLP